MITERNLELIMLATLVFLIGVVVLSIITYVFMGLSLYTAAEVKGIKHKWFAWVPFLNSILVFKLGNKNWKYIWLIVGQTILSIIQYNNPSGILLLIDIVLSIFVVVIYIQAYSNISKEYEINPAWFIVGVIFSPVILVAYILFYNKVRKLKKIGIVNRKI